MTLRQIAYIRAVKRLLPLSLLILFLFNCIGYYFLFLVADTANRNEMQSNLFHSSLETVRIPRSNLSEIIINEDGNEISFHGELYDVKDKAIEGNFIVFHCLHDKKETKLFSELGRNVKANSDSRHSDTKQ